MYESRRKEAFLFDEQAIVPIKNRFWLDLSRFGGLFPLKKRKFSEIIIRLVKADPWNGRYSIRLDFRSFLGQDWGNC